MFKVVSLLTMNAHLVHTWCQKVKVVDFGPEFCFDQCLLTL